MNIKRWLLFLTALMISALVPVTSVHAAASAPSYLYSYDQESHPAPQAYTTAAVLHAQDSGAGKLSSPEDLFISAEGDLYIADTGNHRIVILKRDGTLLRTIDSFDNAGQKDSFNAPQGLYIDPDNGHLYVADTGNSRVVELQPDGTLVKVMGAPQSSIIRSNFQYMPIKLTMDKSKRIYVISKSAYEGILEFDNDGEFTGFVGTNRVRFNPMDLLWKRLSTREQRDQMELFVPLEFNNVDIDAEGFLYTTTSEIDSNEPIKRLNPSGVDILRREGYFPPRGDLEYLEVGSTPGSSTFIDVVADEAGIYHALDSKRGRIFSYDKDGNLLHIFGGMGNQQGRFQAPVAVDTYDEHIYVLDKKLGVVTDFTPTPYGGALRQAIIAHAGGEAELAAEKWQEVLKLNRNNEIAYIGIGKSLLKQDENKEAMAYFELGNSRKYFSEAFKRYREEWVEANFGLIVGSIALVIAVPWVTLTLIRRRRQQAHYVDAGVWRNPFYTMLHPFNGFWEMKFEGKGRLWMAGGVVLTLVLTMILKQQYSGFIVNTTDPSELNTFKELLFVLLPLALWCVANWSLTTLMEGEGKFKEIVMASAYALIPLIVIYLPQIVLSHVVTREEAAFYYLLDSAALLWFVWLLFIGTMTVHQYTAGKTIVTMLLTLVMIGIIIFLGLLLFSVFQQMVSFIISIYNEIEFRM